MKFPDLQCIYCTYVYKYYVCLLVKGYQLTFLLTLSFVHVPHSIAIHEIYLDNCHRLMEFQATFDSTVRVKEVDSPTYAEILLLFCWEAI